MKLDFKSAEWKRFCETNSTKDLAKFLLVTENAQVKEIKILFSNGGEFSTNGVKTEPYKAFKKFSRLSKRKAQ